MLLKLPSHGRRYVPLLMCKSGQSKIAHETNFTQTVQCRDEMPTIWPHSFQLHTCPTTQTSFSSLSIGMLVGASEVWQHGNGEPWNAQSTTELRKRFHTQNTAWCFHPQNAPSQGTLWEHSGCCQTTAAESATPCFSHCASIQYCLPAWVSMLLLA